jgi:hypothetical protein
MGPAARHRLLPAVVPVTMMVVAWIMAGTIRIAGPLHREGEAPVAGFDRIAVRVPAGITQRLERPGQSRRQKQENDGHSRLHQPHASTMGPGATPDPSSMGAANCRGWVPVSRTPTGE